MADVPRKKTLEELRNEAIAELERRGYDVRGKTPAEIRKLLSRRKNKVVKTMKIPTSVSSRDV
jgi:hypothetical protein